MKIEMPPPPHSCLSGHTRRLCEIGAASNAVQFARVEELVVWWRSLSDAPAPFTRRQKQFAGLLTVLIAVTRWFAISRTPWDSDEALFARVVDGVAE